MPTLIVNNTPKECRYYGDTRCVDWIQSGITSFIRGQPLGIGLATTDNADIARGGDGVRALMLRNPIVAKGDQTFYRFFNTKFARPAEGTYGNATKDVIRGPGTNNWGISIAKKWPIGSENFGQFTVAYPARQLQAGLRFGF